MEIREVQIGNISIPYTLYRKKIKRCYLRIKEGKVVITASPLFTIAEIEKLIVDNKDYVLKHIESYEPKYRYEHLGYVTIFNKRYTIIVKDIKEAKCVIHGEYLYVYHENVERVVEEYLKSILLHYITEYITYHQDVVATMPVLVIRKMKSRWGSCFTTRNKIAFNLALIHIDKTLIDYVVLHELCHFLQANHSPLFYQEIEKRMPDYKQRIKQLKGVGI